MHSASDKASSLAQHPFISRKRYHRPHELEGKFKAKSDFVKYFKEAVSATIIFIFNPAVYQLQLYLPPPSTINKDFLKQVLNDEKDFLELSQVKFVTVPVYDELAVGKLWPLMNGNGEFMRYFPDKFSKGRLPDRGYFFNVMNTVEQEYLQGLIKHANEMRNAGTDEKQEHCQIKISDVWWEKLNAMPFISSKSIFTRNLHCRVQRTHALAAEERVEANPSRAQAPEDPTHGHAGGVPPLLRGREVGDGRGLGDDADADRDALALPVGAGEPREADLQVLMLIT
jgi:hypothetical protein